MLYGIRGQYGSGKTTFAKLLQGEFNTKIRAKHPANKTYELKAFGDKLKEMCVILTGIPLWKWNSQEEKIKLMPEVWGVWKAFYTDGEDSHTKLFTSKKEAKDWIKTFHNGYYRSKLDWCVPTLREFMQQLATEGIRNIIHPDSFIIALFNDYIKADYKQYGYQKSNLLIGSGDYPLWIVGDLRVGLSNEYKAIKERDGIIIDIIRPGIEVNNHSSEKILRGYPADITIINDGSLEDLKEKIKDII